MRTNIKKALAVLMTMVLLCGLLPMGMLSVSAATTVLDLNFNDGTIGGFDAGSAVQEGPDGSYCLKWSATSTWGATYKSVSGVYQNGTYVITFKAKASVAGTMGITIQAGNWDDTKYYTEQFATTTAWKEYEITTNVGENPTSSGSILFKFQAQGSTMDLWVDDLVMVEYEEPEPEEPEVPDTPTTSDNLIQNGDFENSNANWSLNSNGSIVSGGRTGYALQMKDPAGQYSAIATQTVALDIGSVYTLTWWSKRVSGTGCFNLYLDGASYSGQQNWMNETSGNWVQQTIELTATSSSLLVKFSNEAANTSGTILIDDVVLTKNPEASFDGFFYNGDFEIGSLQNWTYYSNTAISTAAAHTGSYGAYVSGDGGWGGLLYQNSTGVEAGKTYTISMWAKALDANHGVNIQIKDGGTSGDNLASSYFTKTSWTKLEWTVTPTTNVICLNICGGGTGAAETIYFDDFMMLEEKDPVYDGYLYNGDFETGKAAPYWTVYNDTTVNTASKYEGSFGLNLIGDGGWGGFAYQTITTLKVGKEYTISFKMKITSGGVNVQVLNGSTSGDKLAYKYYAQSNASDWTDISINFTAVSNTVVLNLCGDGTGTAADIYVDNVGCGRVGGEVFPEELHQFGGNSIKENSDGIGLAFKFDIKASGGQKNTENQYVSGSAKIILDEAQYNVVRMGAVMTNDASIGGTASKFNLDAVNGKKIINIDGLYMAGISSDAVSFAVRILDIPESHYGTAIYARPYYVYEENGNEVIVYGGIKSNTYAKVSNPKSSIKILSIGHSFSKDVMVTNLYKMFEQGGYEDITIAYLYMAGCSMPKHLYNINNNLAQYEYSKNTSGTWVNNYNVSALTALKDEEWDYVTVQSSPDYIGGQSISSFKLGIENKGDEITLSSPMTEYEAMDQIISWIKANATNSAVKVDYHMIWSFSEDCELWSYTYHNYNQMQMYNNIITQTKQKVLTHESINSIIPSATSIQNARTSFIGDDFNMPVVPGTQADGYHLNDKGDYVAALTWYCHYSGDNAKVMSGYKGVLTDAQFEAVAEAVNNAMSHWDEVTESTHQ